MASSKRIFVLRHGKSDWDAAYDHDHDRPLAKRGRRGAGAAGRLLAQLGQVPDVVVSSSAVRARDTAARAIEAGEWDRQIAIEPALYGAAAEDVLRIVRGLDERWTSVLIAGHEPTCSSFVALLIGGGRVRMVTAAMARIDCGARSWSRVDPGCGLLRWLVPPRLVQSVEQA